MKTRNKRMIAIQQSIIIVLIVLLVFVTTGAVTYAIYSQFQSATSPIRLANPVIINILDYNESGQILPDDVVVYPGTNFEVKLGFYLGDPDAPNDASPTWSSPAYVIAKVEFTSEVENPDDQDLVIYETNDQPDPANWIMVDFNYTEDQSSPDLWWLYVDFVPGVDANPDMVVAKEITNGTQVDFIDGIIRISEQLGTEYANKEINLTFYVSAIQTENVPLPVNANADVDVAITEENAYISIHDGRKIYKATWPQETWGV